MWFALGGDASLVVGVVTVRVVIYTGSHDIPVTTTIPSALMADNYY